MLKSISKINIWTLFSKTEYKKLSFIHSNQVSFDGFLTRKFRLSQVSFSDVPSVFSDVESNFILSIAHRLTLIRESWKKNPKRGTITERVLWKKNPERSIEKICICFCALDFFPENYAR